jgi:hypothetical protein
MLCSITNRLPYAYATVTAPNIADFCIPDIQRWAFEMYLFESADFEMYPSDIEIKLHILLQFKVPTNFHQSMNCIVKSLRFFLKTRPSNPQS